MIIEKVINNNIVSAFDEDGREVVIMGRGIGFGVRPGAAVRDSKVETRRDLPKRRGRVRKTLG